MTHEETNRKTKMRLANALKEKMKVKSLKKITVKELVEDCGLNRKTFYYHFEDLYDLVKWILEEEAVKVVEQFDFNSNFRDTVNFVLDYVQDNAYMLNCVYDGIGRDEMKRFLYQDFVLLINRLIDLYVVDKDINEHYKAFICDFYCEAIAGVLINWFQDMDKMNKDDVVVYLDTVLNVSIPALLEVNI